MSRLEDVRPEDPHEETRSNHQLLTTEMRRLDDLLDRFGAPEMIDYFSLDTEGSELDILETFPFHERSIRILTVEHNTEERRAEIAEFLSQHDFLPMFPEISRWDGWYCGPDCRPAEPQPSPTPGPIAPSHEARVGQLHLASSMVDAEMTLEAGRVVDVVSEVVGDDVHALGLRVALAEGTQDVDAIGAANEQLAATHPALVGPVLQAASWRQGRGELAAAMSLLLSCSVAHPNVETRKGNLRAIEKDHEAAMACFDAALALDPDNPGALMGKARALRELGRPGEAEQLLRTHRPILESRGGYNDLLASLRAET